MGIILFEHNKKAYDSALALMNETGKAAIIHPTGTGKSFIGFKLAEDFNDKRICWMTPSEYIYKTQIENLINDRNGFKPGNISFFTYSKLMLMSDKEIEDINPQYIILDEFHRCGAEMWGKGVQTLLQLFPNIPVLGLSATAIRYLDNQRNMADELFDGNIASEITLGEAIVRGILNPPTYVTALYSYKKDLEKYERRINNARNKAIRDAGERYLEALRRTLEKADGLDVIFQKYINNRSGKYIVFCANKEHMDEMVSKVPLWFRNIDLHPNIYCVYSSDPETNNSFIEFKKDKSEHLKLLFCIDMLNEGIHVDDVTGVILFRPTVSPIIFKQQIGRALCAGKNNKALILDIVDNISNLYSISDIKKEMKEAITFFENVGENRYIVNETFKIIDELSDCKKLFNNLEKTLSASWDYMYDVAKKYFEIHGNLLPLQTYTTEDGYKLGQWIVTQRAIYLKKDYKSLSQDRIQKLEQIGMSWFTLKERQWEEGFELAKAYYLKNGNLNISTDNFQKLAYWINNQRIKYRTNELTNEQFNRLSEIGMVWELNDVWQQRYKEAKKYYEQFGNLDIPANYVTKNGIRLGLWYRMVRNLYRDGQLSNDKIKQFEKIGMQWTSIKIRNWMQYYSLASDYYKEHGNLNINANFVSTNGTKLGSWISGLRYAYSKQKLTTEQIELLEKIGMCWHRFKSRWGSGLLYAEQYFKQNGDINAPINYITSDGFTLGIWIALQRKKYKSGKLNVIQTQQLEELKINWSPLDAYWPTGYKYAIEFFQKYGRLDASVNYVTEDGFKLGSWISNQRSKYKKGDLSSEQIILLEQVGICWCPIENRWQKGFEHAQKYFEKYNNLDVPKGYLTGDCFNLRNWIDSQKKSYKRGVLESYKIEMLEHIGIEWTILEKKWKIGYDHAKQYMINNKNKIIPKSFVSPDGFKLGEWIRGQERKYQRRKLQVDRKLLLEQIGINFEVYFETKGTFLKGAKR